MGPEHSLLLLLQVRGKGGHPLGLHHRSGGLGCGLDSLRPATPSHQRVDAGGWSSGASRPRSVSDRRVRQGHTLSSSILFLLLQKLNH